VPKFIILINFIKYFFKGLNLQKILEIYAYKDKRNKKDKTWEKPPYHRRIIHSSLSEQV